jgi:hypothetical protein
MHSRAPWYVFFAAFATFLLAFGVLVVVGHPRFGEAREAATREAQRAATVSASLPGMPRSANASAPAGMRRAVGNVVDGRGHPISGATITAQDSEGATLATATVDVQGRFDFALGAGSNISLAISAPGYQTANAAAEIVRDTRLDFATVMLRDGGALRLRISGDSEGALANAKVRLLPIAGDANAPLAETTTGPDGSALLRGIDSGSYRLRIEADGHAACEEDWRFDGVGPDGNGELAFVLLPLATYVSGEVVDEQHESVATGAVVVRLVRPEPPAPQEWRGAVGRDGTFRIGPLPRGTFSVELEAPGMAQLGQLFADGDGEPVELVAHHGGGLNGRFDSDASLPVAPTVTLWKLEPTGRVQPVTAPYRATVDLAARTFRIEGFGPGRYIVRASADGYAPARSEPFEIAVGQAPDEVALQFSGGTDFRGSLVDHRGAPVAGARITIHEGLVAPTAAWSDLLPADARIAATTGDDGAWSASGLSIGSHVVLLEAKGQPPRSFGPLWFDEGSTTSLPTLAIAGGAVVSLTLHDEDGRAAAYGRVRVSCSALGLEAIAVADEKGNVCLRGLPAGSYWLTSCDGGEPHEATLTTGETTRLELQHAAR